jgi:hypothetical protein
VFSNHYHRICELSCRKAIFNHINPTGEDLSTTIVQLIRKSFLQRSPPYCQTRKDLVLEFQDWLSRIKSHSLCLSCLQRPPQHQFHCQHSICEQCAIEMAENNLRDPLLYTFETCPFCSQIAQLSIRMHPITASSRVLSIDGGGVRAIIPIQFLRALQAATGLSMPIQEHFEFCYGTSSGMINLKSKLLDSNISQVLLCVWLCIKKVCKSIKWTPPSKSCPK